MFAVVIAGSLAAVAVGDGPEPPAPPPNPATAPAAEPALPTADWFDREATRRRLWPLCAHLTSYAHDHDGCLPADITDAAGKPLLSWRVAVLPCLDQDALYEQFRLDEPWDSEHNKRLARFVPKAYRSPHTPAGHTRLQAFVGPAAAVEPGRRLRIGRGGADRGDFPDGVEHVLFAAEAGPPVPWTKPADHPFDPKGPLPPLDGPYADGFAGMWAGGSVWWLVRDGRDGWLRGAIQRADGVGQEAAPRGPAPGRPPTARERAETDRWREAYSETWRRGRPWADERFRLEAELRKAGPIPPREVADVDDLAVLRSLHETAREMSICDRHEAERLWQLVEQRDPKAAERLRAEIRKDNQKDASPSR